MTPDQEAQIVRAIHLRRRAVPDWEHLFRLNHHFRAISVAVGDRHRPLGLWRIFGYLGEHECSAGSLHGPWRPTQALALRAVHNRARRIGRITT